MTLAIILVFIAVVALVVVFAIGYSVSRRALRFPPGAKSDKTVQPLDVEAFRNLIDPAEREYLRRRLPAVEFRQVQRARLHAMESYVLTARQNAVVLVQAAESALVSSNPQTAEAARQLIDNALLLQRNATFAFWRIRVARLWPDSNMAAAPILQRYMQLNGSAMLLGRLQNPAVPVRISAS